MHEHSVRKIAESRLPAALAARDSGASRVRAVAQDRYGGREVLTLRELPSPALKAGELRVRVKAAGLNPSDWNIRAGRARLLVPYSFPLVLGSDFSGVVTEVGPGVTDFAAGDEVFGAADAKKLGAFAEEVCVDAGLVAFKPADLSHIDAAALPVAGQTAWRALFEELMLSPTDHLLVLAGGGAVGTVALQLARAHGAEVAATARPRHLAALEKIGVTSVVDGGAPDRFAAHGKFDAIFDTVGAPERVRAFEALGEGGRLVSIAGMPTGDGAKAHNVPFPLRVVFDLLSAREHLKAARGGREYRYFFVDPSGVRMRELARSVAEHRVRAPVDSVHALDDFDAAFTQLETGRLNGKVILAVDREP